MPCRIGWTLTFRTIRDLLILISVKLPKIPEDPKLPVLFSEPFIFRAPSSSTTIALYILACKLIQDIIHWLKTFFAYFLTIISQRDAKMSTDFDPEFRLDRCGMFFPLFYTNRWMILLKSSFCIIQIRLSDQVLLIDMAFSLAFPSVCLFVSLRNFLPVFVCLSVFWLTVCLSVWLSKYDCSLPL